MSDAVGTRVEDFYEELIRLIEDGEVENALALFATLEAGYDEQLDALFQIASARALARDLARALALAIDLDLALESDRALAIDLDLARARARALDLARARALDLAHALESDRARVLARALARDRYSDQVAFIVATPIMQAAAVKSVVPSGTITFDGIDILTPQILATQVSPYLEALTEIQTVISDLKNEPVPTFEISTISKVNPVLISLLGIPEALNAVLDLVVPWRREHEKEMKRLEREEKGASIVDTWTDTAEKEINNKYKDAELQMQNERLRLENEMLREELKEKRNRRLQSELELMEVAMSVVQKYVPDLPKPQQLEYAKKLLAPTNTIVSSRLELRDGREEQEGSDDSDGS